MNAVKTKENVLYEIYEEVLSQTLFHLFNNIDSFINSTVNKHIIKLCLNYALKKCCNNVFPNNLD